MILGWAWRHHLNQYWLIISQVHPANERWRYIVTSSLIGWMHTQNDPWMGTKTLPEPILTNHEPGLVGFTWACAEGTFVRNAQVIYLSSTRSFILKIRQSHGSLIFIMGILYLENQVFILKQGQEAFSDITSVPDLLYAGMAMGSNLKDLISRPSLDYFTVLVHSPDSRNADAWTMHGTVNSFWNS